MQVRVPERRRLRTGLLQRGDPLGTDALYQPADVAVGVIGLLQRRPAASHRVQAQRHRTGGVALPGPGKQRKHRLGPVHVSVALVPGKEVAAGRHDLGDQSLEVGGFLRCFAHLAPLLQLAGYLVVAIGEVEQPIGQRCRTPRMQEVVQGLPAILGRPGAPGACLHLPAGFLVDCRRRAAEVPAPDEGQRDLVLAEPAVPGACAVAAAADFAVVDPHLGRVQFRAIDGGVNRRRVAELFGAHLDGA